MKKMIGAFILICFILTAGVSGCLSSDDGNNAADNTADNATGYATDNAADDAADDTSDSYNIVESLIRSMPMNPINKSSYMSENGTAYLTKQTRIADDRKSITFVFDENEGHKWELKMAPLNVLNMTTDEHIDSDGTNKTPDIHVWVLESAEPGRMIMNFNCVSEDEGKIISNVYYIIEVLDSKDIRIMTVLYERI